MRVHHMVPELNSYKARSSDSFLYSSASEACGICNAVDLVDARCVFRNMHISSYPRLSGIFPVKFFVGHFQFRRPSEIQRSFPNKR